MQQQRKIESLSDILKKSPEAQAYFRELRERGALKLMLTAEQAPACETCGGVGFVVPENLPYDHPLFSKPMPCPAPDCPTLKELRDTRYAKLCTLAQIPAEYQSLTFAEWEILEQYPEWINGKRGALGAARAFIEAAEYGFKFTLFEAAEIAGVEVPEFDSGRKCSIVYSGPNGVGKTALAVSIARAGLDRGYSVVYVRLMEFLDALKERFEKKDSYELGGDAEDEAGVMRTYQQAPILIIDEFPAERTDWRKERVEQLVNYRYTHQLPTIITTNLDAKTLTDIWGLTTGHRIQAMSHWIEVGGKELRPRAAAWKAS